jgi:hypothetical protein
MEKNEARKILLAWQENQKIPRGTILFTIFELNCGFFIEYQF